MLTALATFLGIKWIAEHQTETIIILAAFVFLIWHLIHRKRKAIAQAQRAAAEQRARQEEQQRLARERAEEEQRRQQEHEEQEEQVISVPQEIDGATIAYQYHDVMIIPGVSMAAHPGDKLDLVDDGNDIYVKANGSTIGRMKENRLAGMVRDWKKHGNPFLAYFVQYTDAGPMIALFFYDDALSKFQMRNPDAKLVKLIGRPEEGALYSVGAKCEVVYDPEKEKYGVTCGGDLIGTLPKSATDFAEKNDTDPEYLDVIIGKIDYDFGKDRDIISVYIA